MKGTNKTKEHMEIYLYVSTLTEVFVNQKIINVCEHTVKMVTVLSKIHEEKEQEED
jgi:hypothetical protein